MVTLDPFSGPNVPFYDIQVSEWLVSVTHLVAKMT